jgi:hypothetical protein
MANQLHNRPQMAKTNLDGCVATKQKNKYINSRQRSNEEQRVIKNSIIRALHYDTHIFVPINVFSFHYAVQNIAECCQPCYAVQPSSAVY